MDGTVRQIAVVNGLIGHDHLGEFNWDGAWPYWGRATYRTGGWDKLGKFMAMVNKDYNTKLSFHVNLTDVNVGLKDYPETQEFFKKLVETKSIYRRDWNKETNKRDMEPPYVPQDFPTTAAPNAGMDDPVGIFALVNYNNFWDSGLAKTMIDEFYSKLPYAPPVLYVDVFNAAGGNFSTGYPDGPLGGSQKTQIEGAQKIAAYLREKGTDVGMEGDQSATLGKYGTYSWLHAEPGYSKDDYSVIIGAAKGSRAVNQQVLGNTGCFVVSAVGCTPEQIVKVRAHYKELLAGQPITRKMPGLETWHISDRGGDNDEFNMTLGGGGGGDPFRGDWIDLVNNFYLSGIQELYHIGKGNYRTATLTPQGAVHVSQFGVIDPSGKETIVPIMDMLPASIPDWVVNTIKKHGEAMLDTRYSFTYDAPQAGEYKFKVWGGISGHAKGTMNVYANNKLESTSYDIKFPLNPEFKAVDREDFMRPVELCVIQLKKGKNEISVDGGPVYSEWNDGTRSIWQTPTLGTGFKVNNGDVTFAYDYDRMWPDTWSGQKKIYFYSWDGSNRTWKVPQDWADVKKATLFPLTPDGRGKGISIAIKDRSIAPKLLPQVPYVLVPDSL
jgi:hypothetical protein